MNLNALRCALAAAALALATSAEAQLRVTPVTWNVVGLDHNKPLAPSFEGPDTFPTAIRVTNDGAVDATNVVCTFVWTDTSNPGGADITCQRPAANGGNVIRTEYINLDTPTNTFTTPLIPPGGSYEFWFNLDICRNAASFNKRRGFRFDVTSNEYPSVSSPTPREIFVEALRGQARNDVISFVGPTTVLVGQTYTYLMTNTTATGGYEQLTTWSNFPPQVFEYLEVQFNTNNPFPGQTLPYPNVYSDACMWDPVPGPTPPQGTYLSCLSTGKVGNNNTVRTTVRPRAGGSAALDNLIYDKSGASFHYNADVNVGILILDSQQPAALNGIVYEDMNFNFTYDAGIDRLIEAVDMIVRGAGPDGIFNTADDIVGRISPGPDGIIGTNPGPDLVLGTSDDFNDDIFTPFSSRTSGTGFYEETNLLAGLWRTSPDPLSPSLAGLTEIPPNGGNFRAQKEVLIPEGGVGEMNYGYFNQVLAVDLAYFRAFAFDGQPEVRITWETIEEIDNAGFNVYRAVEGNRTGLWEPGEKLNADMIPASIEPGVYDYFDPLPIHSESDVRGYFLEDVDLVGNPTMQGPAFIIWNAAGANVEAWDKY